MSEYRILQTNEVIQPGDEYDDVNDGWREGPNWVPVNERMVGAKAPDPHYPSHRLYRRRAPC